VSTARNCGPDHMSSRAAGAVLSLWYICVGSGTPAITVYSPHRARSPQSPLSTLFPPACFPWLGDDSVDATNHTIAPRPPPHPPRRSAVVAAG
jgi:hypothetical protein